MNKKVTVIGGLNMDIKAKSMAVLLPGESNPSKVDVSAGGVGRNIAHNLALLNIDTTLLTAVGKDSEGESIIKETAASGVKVDNIFLSSKSKTGKYIAILDENGEMALAVSDMEVLEDLTIDYLKSNAELMKSSDFIICDTNLSRNCLSYILDFSRSCGVPVCIDPVSAAKAVKLKGLLKGIYIIKPNRKELEILSGTEAGVEASSKALVELGVSNIIATLGAEGLCHTDINKSTRYASIAKDIADVTGAGDSLTAGLVYGLLKYQSFQEACQCGLAAAAITLSSKDTVSAELSEEAINRLLNKKPL